MIDPSNITNYNLNDAGLEENLIFWILAAGKTAKTMATSLKKVLEKVDGVDSPFEALRNYNGNLAELFKKQGIGCYNNKAKTVMELINSRLDLRNCGYEELEKIWGIGMKTSRCYFIHTRGDSKVAGLDTHILKFLSGKGIDVPKTTPGVKKYLELEQQFLKFVPKGMSVAEFDLKIWNEYTRR